MQRLVDAFINSVRAFRKLAAHEKAFQQELLLFVLALPAIPRERLLPMPGRAA